MNKSQSLPNIPNLAFAEELYAQYLSDAASVSPEWRAYFGSLESQTQNGAANGSTNGHSTNGASAKVEPFKLAPSFRPPTLFESREGKRSSLKLSTPAIA